MARYWSEAAKERGDPAGIFYYWKGERPRYADAPQLEGTGEIRVETADRATEYWTTRSDGDTGLNARTFSHSENDAMTNSLPVG